MSAPIATGSSFLVHSIARGRQINGTIENLMFGEYAIAWNSDHVDGRQLIFVNTFDRFGTDPGLETLALYHYGADWLYNTDLINLEALSDGRFLIQSRDETPDPTYESGQLGIYDPSRGLTGPLVADISGRQLDAIRTDTGGFILPFRFSYAFDYDSISVTVFDGSAGLVGRAAIDDGGFAGHSPRFFRVLPDGGYVVYWNTDDYVNEDGDFYQQFSATAEPVTGRMPISWDDLASVDDAEEIALAVRDALATGGAVHVRPVEGGVDGQAALYLDVYGADGVQRDFGIVRLEAFGVPGDGLTRTVTQAEITEGGHYLVRATYTDTSTGERGAIISLFALDGTHVGEEIRFPSLPAGAQGVAHILHDVLPLPDGGFLAATELRVTFEGNVIETALYLSRYDASGQRDGSSVRISDNMTDGTRDRFTEMTLVDGGQVVVLFSRTDATSGEPDILARAFELDFASATGIGDALSNEIGAQAFDGLQGNDTVSYADATDRVLVDLATDLGAAPFARFFGSGAAEGDTFTAIESAFGGAFADNLRGNAERNHLVGGAVSDRLYGRAGDDRLDGGTGSDALYGNLGADVLTGGGSADEGRRDRFIYFSAADSGVGREARDLITDFIVGEDRIEISRLDADATRVLRQEFTFIGDAPFSSTPGELGYRHEEGSTIVQADLDGDGTPDFEIELLGTMDLSLAEFLL